MGSIISSSQTINMGNCILNISIFLAVLGIVSVNAGDSSNLADPVLFCDGCFALVSEVEKDMSLSKGKKLNNRIETSLSGVCSTDKPRAYKFSPPTQVKTCNAILGKYRRLSPGCSVQRLQVLVRAGRFLLSSRRGRGRRQRTRQRPQRIRILLEVKKMSCG